LVHYYLSRTLTEDPFTPKVGVTKAELLKEDNQDEGATSKGL